MPAWPPPRRTDGRRWPTSRPGPGCRWRWSRSSSRDAPGASAATRERVRRAADELGYRPDSRARLLRSSRSRLLGVVFGVQHAFHGDLVGGLYAAAEAARLRARAQRRDARPRRAAGRSTSLLQDRCEALILLGPQSPDGATWPGSPPGCRWSCVARGVRHRAVDVVRTADDEGLQPGRRPSGRARPPPHRARRRRPGARARPTAGAATASALHRHGLATPRSGSCPAGSPRTTAPPPPGPCSRGRRRRPRSPSSTTGAPPACSTSCAAPGCRCRDDVSVVGYDDSRLARLSHVDLTTVAQDAAAITTLAVARAVERLDGTPVGRPGAGGAPAPGGPRHHRPARHLIHPFVHTPAAPCTDRTMCTTGACCARPGAVCTARGDLRVEDGGPCSHLRPLTRPGAPNDARRRSTCPPTREAVMSQNAAAPTARGRPPPRVPLRELLALGAVRRRAPAGAALPGGAGPGRDVAGPRVADPRVFVHDGRHLLGVPVLDSRSRQLRGQDPRRWCATLLVRGMLVRAGRRPSLALGVRVPGRRARRERRHRATRTQGMRGVTARPPRRRWSAAAIQSTRRAAASACSVYADGDRRHPRPRVRGGARPRSGRARAPRR